MSIGVILTIILVLFLCSVLRKNKNALQIHFFLFKNKNYHLKNNIKPELPESINNDFIPIFRLFSSLFNSLMSKIDAYV